MSSGDRIICELVAQYADKCAVALCEFLPEWRGPEVVPRRSQFSAELFNDAARRSVPDVLRAVGPQSSAPLPAALPSRPLRSGERVGLRLPGPVRWVPRRRQQDVHWGQVAPLEDACQPVDMLDWIVRLPCTCRASTTGHHNARYCYRIGVAPLEEPMRLAFREAGKFPIS